MSMIDITPTDTQKDPFFGFEVDRSARKLILAFLTFSFVIIGLGSIAALLMVYTRAPDIMLLSPKWYYMTLTYHGILMLTIFPHLFEVGLMFYGATALLKSRLYSSKLAWVGFGLILVGVLTILITISGGDASVMYTMYVPLRANGWFYVGHFLYASGLFVELAVFSLTLLAWKGKNPGKSLPLVVYGMGIMAILLTVSLLSAVVAFVPATLWAFRIVIKSVDPLVFKNAFWGMGHTLQYVNNVGLVVAWYMVSGYVHHAKPSSEKFSRMAFALYTFTTVPVMVHHLIVDPSFSPVYKYIGATAMGAFLGIPSMMHGFAVPGAIESTIRKQQRERGEQPTRFGFLRHWGWNNPSMVLIAFSVVAFGIGGFDGTVATTVPLNMLFHNTFFITAHFHGTLAAGMAIAYMALAYYLLPALGIDIVARKWVKFQAWCTGIGFVLLVAMMHWAAELGVPRRTQDIHYAHAGAPVPNWFAPMNFLAVGGTLAAVGVITFVVIVVVSIIKAKPIEKRNVGVNGLWPGESWVEQPQLAAGD
jgi:cytochrome c oxidase subunit I